MTSRFTLYTILERHCEDCVQFQKTGKPSQLKAQTNMLTLAFVSNFGENKVTDFFPSGSSYFKNKRLLVFANKTYAYCYRLDLSTATNLFLYCLVWWVPLASIMTLESLLQMNIKIGIKENDVYFQLSSISVCFYFTSPQNISTFLVS